MTLVIAAILIYFISMNRSNSIIASVSEENRQLKKQVEDSKQEMYDLANDFLCQQEELKKQIDYLSK